MNTSLFLSNSLHIFPTLPPLLTLSLFLNLLLRLIVIPNIFLVAQISLVNLQAVHSIVDPELEFFVKLAFQR